MAQDMEIKIVVDSSLLAHFKEGLRYQRSKNLPEDEITKLVALMLNDSSYPIEAHKTGEREIHISYHLRSFSQPIFD